MFGASVNEDGFGIFEDVFSASEIESLLADFSRTSLPRSRATP